MRHKGGLGDAGSHPAVFPVALVEAVLTAFSDPGDLIHEPFCGSGTQIVAAERAERRCLNRPGFTGGQHSRGIARFGTCTKVEDREAVFP
jgi:DNA modification methylase